MDAPDLVGLFIGPLERLGLEYMITGGVASVIYGDPRFTRDIDIVVRLRRRDVERVAAAFDEHAFYVPPIEVVREETARPRGGHFSVIHWDSVLKDLYVSGDDPLHDWAFERRRRLALEDLEVWLAPIEYVILRKLEYHRMSGSDRHLRDIREMLRLSGTIADLEAIAIWVDRLGLAAEWRAARRV